MMMKMMKRMDGSGRRSSVLSRRRKVCVVRLRCVYSHKGKIDKGLCVVRSWFGVVVVEMAWRILGTLWMRKEESCWEERSLLESW